jgi:hypothetical protein
MMTLDQDVEFTFSRCHATANVLAPSSAVTIAIESLAMDDSLQELQSRR